MPSGVSSAGSRLGGDSTAVTTEGAGPTGGPTGSMMGRPTGPPAGQPTDPGPTQGQGPGPTRGAGSQHSMANGVDPAGLSSAAGDGTAPAQQTTGPMESSAPTHLVVSHGNGPVTGPMGMDSSTGPPGQAAPTCTCHNG